MPDWVENEQGGKQSGSPHFFRGLPTKALMRVARVLKHGAEEYESDPFGDVSVRNWHKISSREHLEHLLAHIIMEIDGNTSEDHPGHIATRALFYLHMHILEHGGDDAATLPVSEERDHESREEDAAMRELRPTVEQGPHVSTLTAESRDQGPSCTWRSRIRGLTSEPSPSEGRVTG